MKIVARTTEQILDSIDEKTHRAYLHRANDTEAGRRLLAMLNGQNGARVKGTRLCAALIIAEHGPILGEDITAIASDRDRKNYAWSTMRAACTWLKQNGFIHVAGTAPQSNGNVASLFAIGSTHDEGDPR